MANVKDGWYRDKRLGGLRRFAISITILNILGHTVLGFEQAWLHPFVALATAYGMELGIEATHAWADNRRPKFMGSPRQLIDFLLPAHITALAVSMLLYTNERFWVLAFASAMAIGSKELFRAPAPIPSVPRPSVPRPSVPESARQSRHFLNPSNFGITCTLVLFPWVGIAPPYQFTEMLRGPLDILFPLLIVGVGSMLNTKFTERMPLLLAWVGGFLAQAVIRTVLADLPVVPALLPATGFAFVLFTFYMVTDPGTTPFDRRGQIVFGLSVAAIYGLLVAAHMVFGLFFALTIVSFSRGLLLYWAARERLVPPSIGPVLAPIK